MKRQFICCGLLLIAFFILGESSEPQLLQAADAKSEAKLKNQVQTLQNSLNAAQTQITTLQNQVTQQNATIKQLNGNADAKKGLDTIKKASYIHTVILTLKSDSKSTEGQSMLDDLANLQKISTVRGLWYGSPADKATPDLANKDFTVGITILFDDYDGLKSYLDDPAHKKFTDKHLKFFETPVVYDVLKTATP